MNWKNAVFDLIPIYNLHLDFRLFKSHPFQFILFTKGRKPSNKYCFKMSRLSLSLLNFIIQPDQPCKDGQKRHFYCTHFHSWSSDLSSHSCYKPTITMALHQPNRRRKMIGNIQHTQIKMYEGLALSFFIHISYRTMIMPMPKTNQKKIFFISWFIVLFNSFWVSYLKV